MLEKDGVLRARVAKFDGLAAELAMLVDVPIGRKQALLRMSEERDDGSQVDLGQIAQRSVPPRRLAFHELGSAKGQHAGGKRHAARFWKVQESGGGLRRRWRRRRRRRRW